MKMKLLFILLSVGSFLLHHGAYSVDSVELSVTEGDSVTLHICVEKKKEEILKWYFNKILIARINGHPKHTCTEDQCEYGAGRFRDRLKLDHQTGSLTIMNIRITDSGVYELKNSSGRHNSEKIFSVSVHGVPDGEQEKMKKKSVNEGESVTLDPDEVKNPSDVMWYFNGILIAQTPGDQNKTYTDVQCNERFRDRLKLDNQTGSLTIMNITDTYSGHYICEVQSKSNRKRRSISNNVDFFKVNINLELSVTEGDSVTLHICVEKKKEEILKWYFNKILIAGINGDPKHTCTDVQCNNDTERFRGRLKLDNQTGSLTIMNITNTDSGEYTLTNSGSSNSEKIFSVSVHGVPDGEREKMKKKSVNEGDSVTLDPDKIKNPNDVMMWYFNGTLIAQTPGDQNKIYKGVQCKDSFRDRLKLDNQTGSLTIMNITDTDAGHYIFEVQSKSNRKRRSISNNVKFFEVKINPSGPSPDDPPSGPSSLVVGICVSLLMAVAVAIFLTRRRRNAVKDPATASEESPMNE